MASVRVGAIAMALERLIVVTRELISRQLWLLCLARIFRQRPTPVGVERARD